MYASIDSLLSLVSHSPPNSQQDSVAAKDGSSECIQCPKWEQQLCPVQEMEAAIVSSTRN